MLGEGKWVLVFRQTAGDYSWPTWRKNVGDPDEENYAILDELEKFRGSDGKLAFKLQWPGHSEGPQIWKQTSNPTASSTVKGYEDVDVKCRQHNWYGLALSEGGAEAKIDGSRGIWIYYGIMTKLKIGKGIPACEGSSKSVELYVWEESHGADSVLLAVRALG